MVAKPGSDSAQHKCLSAKPGADIRHLLRFGLKWSSCRKRVALTACCEGVFLVSSLRTTTHTAANLPPSRAVSAIPDSKKAAQVLGLATILQAKDKLDVTFPVKTDGLLRIQPLQWEQFVLPVRGQEMELGAF